MPRASFCSAMKRIWLPWPQQELQGVKDAVPFCCVLCILKFSRAGGRGRGSGLSEAPPSAGRGRGDSGRGRGDAGRGATKSPRAAGRGKDTVRGASDAGGSSGSGAGGETDIVKETLLEFEKLRNTYPSEKHTILTVGAASKVRMG